MDFLTELFYLGVIGIVMFVVLQLTVKYQRKAVYSFFIIFVLFCLQHIYMSVKLADVKTEFKTVAMDGPMWLEGHVTDNGASSMSADYGGEIKKIIIKRNLLLKQRGYKILGRWNLSTSYSHEVTSLSTAALYVWFPL